jgi:ABC-type dipeptide/oligopeptide/nickel transport system permease subunit
MIAISAVGWASFARLIRGHVLTLREAPFVDAARAMGCSSRRILFVHLMPQCIPLGLVMMGLKVGGYILTEASLSFLGLGAQPPTASWGSMISTSRSYLVVAPWMVIFPGLAIAAAALAFNMLGDALSERFGIRKTL